MRHPGAVAAHLCRRVAALAVCLVAGSTLVLPLPRAGASGLGTSVDFASLHDEQIEVLTRNYQTGVMQADTALNSATEALSSDRAALTTDVSSAAAAAAEAAAATTSLVANTAAHLAAVTAHTMALSTLGTDRSRLAQVAVALYIGSSPQVPNIVGDLTDAEAAADGQIYLSINRHELSTLVVGDTANVASTTSTERELSAAMTRNYAVLSAATTAGQAAQATVSRTTTEVNRDQMVVAAAGHALKVAQQAQTTALAAIGPPGADGSPTILGTPVLEPAELAGWYNAGYYLDLTAARIVQMAAWYVSEGRAEDVRGDVAFAQAIVETGGFGSPDAISFNNYAGVGHCDSCATGLDFPSPEGGVRGQIQLLRIFASPPGTPLTQPAIIPAVAPGGQFRGGCCPSWQSLTGTWATDPNYGNAVLTTYKSMLDYALSQPPVAPAVAPPAGLETVPAAGAKAK